MQRAGVCSPVGPRSRPNLGEVASDRFVPDGHCGTTWPISATDRLEPARECRRCSRNRHAEETENRRLRKNEKTPRRSEATILARLSTTGAKMAPSSLLGGEA